LIFSVKLQRQVHKKVKSASTSLFSSFEDGSEALRLSTEEGGNDKGACARVNLRGGTPRRRVESAAKRSLGTP
jgi:hypothetical protein